jgi:hypothetical protein
MFFDVKEIESVIEDDFISLDDYIFDIWCILIVFYTNFYKLLKTAYNQAILS